MGPSNISLAVLQVILITVYSNVRITGPSKNCNTVNNGNVNLKIYIYAPGTGGAAGNQQESGAKTQTQGRRTRGRAHTHFKVQPAL